MDKILPLSGKKPCSVLEKDNFRLARQTGSHRIYQKIVDDSAVTILVPVHSNKPLKK